MKIFRAYDIGRDKGGMPNKLTWRGDFYIDPKKTQPMLDQDKLAEWEKIYGQERMTEGENVNTGD